MDMSEVKAFNAELSGLYDNKPPISKAKMSAITRGAIKAIKFYKHVVHSVEKFIQKCKPEYKVPGLYVIDSIVRQSRHQFGQDKDVFAPRFAKNMQQTFANLFRCPPEDKRNIIRVLNLWQKNNVFSSDVIQPLLDMADPNHPLHQEIQQQQNNTANGSGLNVSHNSGDKLSPSAAQQHTPHSSTPMGDQFQDQPSGIPSGGKFNRKLLNDFDYESEDEAPPPAAPPPHSHAGHTHTTHASHTSHTSHSSHHHNPADALGSILTNPEIMRQLQSLQAQMQMMTGMQIPNLMPMMTDMQMQQNQNQNLPFMSSQQDQQKSNEPKEDGTNESDIEFVETGPQVIEIPDANDSRSPSPKSRRHRSRSKSPKRRRRSRSRSPRRRRDRDRERDRDRDRDREKDREKSYKEREADREKQKEREKKGLPPIKKENLSVCSTTLWVGHLSKLATQEELSDLFGAIGGVVSIDVVAPRGCAFVVMERRRDAYKALQKLNKHKLHSKEICVAWAPGKGVKGREWKDQWEAELGVSYLPWAALQARWALGALQLDALEDGGAVDEDTLPPWLPPRIMPKMDSLPMLPNMPNQPGMMPNMPPGSMSNLSNIPTPNMPPGTMPPGGMPPGSMPPANMLPGNMPPGNMPPGNMPPGNMPPGNMPPGNMPPGNMPAGLMSGNMPTGLPNAAPGSNMANLGNMPMQVPRMPPPGMPAGLPPGLTGGMAGSMAGGMRGALAGEGLATPAPLLGFPPAMPPHSIAQPGMVGGFLGGLLGVGGLVAGVPLQLHAAHSAHAAHTAHSAHVTTPTARTTEISASDDAMELDTEDNHEDSPPAAAPTAAPPLLSDQLQALLSKPPPNFNASEPPPGFNMNEPPPFNSQPPPANEDKDDDRKDRDRDRRDSRRDRDRDRDNRRERGDRDRRERDRGGRDRDRNDREDRRDRDRGDRNERNERGDRNERNERTERGGRERRDRDRDRDRERGEQRFPGRDNRERSREKSPRSTNPDQPNEKTLQERLWEMANGKPPSREDSQDTEHDGSESSRVDRPPPLLDRPPMRDMPPAMMDSVAENEGGGLGGSGGGGGGAGGGESGWTQLPPPRMPPPHIAGTFRAELRMRGPPRQPMRGPWMEGPGPGPGPFGPRFNGMGPPFNRPPFDRPPFEGPLFDGPPRFERPPFNRMPFDNMSRPPFDGPRPPFDGPRPPFDGPRPPFDGPPRQFDGPPFDGPPFEGPEFFDRNNRRFDDREQFQERGWNGERDREWDRRNEWDDRRRDNRRSRDHEDRFRDRGDRPDRRRPFDERRGPRDDRNPREDRPYRDDKDKNMPKDDKSNKDGANPAPTPPITREDRRRDKDRKSRWGAAEETTNQSEDTAPPQQVNPAPDDVTSDVTADANMDTGESSHVEQNERNFEAKAEDNMDRNTEYNEDKIDERDRFRNEPNESHIEDSTYEKQDASEKPYDINEDRQNSGGQERIDTDHGHKNIEAENDTHEQSQNYERDNFGNSQQERDAGDSIREDTSYREPEPPSAPSDAPSLYDTTDAIDTSFAAAPVETIPVKDTVVDTPETKIDDIFSQPEAKEVPSASEAPAATESKEGVA